MERRLPSPPELTSAKKVAHQAAVSVLALTDAEANSAFTKGDRVKWHAMCLFAKELQEARDRLKP